MTWRSVVGSIDDVDNDGRVLVAELWNDAEKCYSKH